MQNNRTNFCSRNNYFWKVPISHIIQIHWKNQLYYELFSFNLTVKYTQLYNFHLWNCLWIRNIYRLVVRKVFLFQMLGETSIFTLSAKVPVWQKCQNNILCGNTNMFLFYNDCLDLCCFIVDKKRNDIPSQTGLSNYYS